MIAQRKDRPALKRMQTPVFRVSFPNLFKPAAFGKNEPKFSVTGIIRPSEFTPDDAQKWGALLAELLLQMRATLYASYNPGDPNIRWPVRSGMEPKKAPIAGYGPGTEFFVMSSSIEVPPQVVLQNLLPASPADVYAGCWCRATVIPFAYSNEGQGGGFLLGNVQKVRDDEAFGASAVDPSSEFEQLPFEGQAPAPQYPAQQAPVPQYPAQQTPVPQYPAQQAPAQQAPVPQYPAQQTPVPQYPAQQTPVPQYPAQPQGWE